MVSFSFSTSCMGRGFFASARALFKSSIKVCNKATNKLSKLFYHTPNRNQMKRIHNYRCTFPAQIMWCIN
jgi:hypothetical protein